MDPMKEALNRRRGKGVDVTILLNGLPEGVEVGNAEVQNADDQNSDLAPKGEQDSELPEHGEGTQPEEQEVDASAGDDEMGESITSGMSDFDKEDLQNRKPRSLGDRVKLAAMGRMGKK